MARNLPYFLSISGGEHNTRAARATARPDDFAGTPRFLNSRNEVLNARRYDAKGDLRFVVLAQYRVEGLALEKTICTSLDNFKRLLYPGCAPPHPCDELRRGFTGKPRINKDCAPQ